jgi:hypothetical protein
VQLLSCLHMQGAVWAGGEGDHLVCRYAGALFADAVLKGLNGATDQVQCAYVESSVVPGLQYFASKVRHGYCSFNLPLFCHDARSENDKICSCSLRGNFVY